MDLQSTLNTALLKACASNLLETVKILVDMGANAVATRYSVEHTPDGATIYHSRDASPLHLAVINSNVDMIKYFISLPHFVETNRDRSILVAIYTREYDIFKLLWDAGVLISSNHLQEFHDIASQDEEVLSILSQSKRRPIAEIF